MYRQKVLREGKILHLNAECLFRFLYRPISEPRNRSEKRNYHYADEMAGRAERTKYGRGELSFYTDKDIANYWRELLEKMQVSPVLEKARSASNKSQVLKRNLYASMKDLCRQRTRYRSRTFARPIKFAISRRW